MDVKKIAAQIAQQEKIKKDLEDSLPIDLSEHLAHGFSDPNHKWEAKGEYTNGKYILIVKAENDDEKGMSMGEPSILTHKYEYVVNVTLKSL